MNQKITIFAFAALLVFGQAYGQLSTEFLTQTLDQRVECEDIVVSGANSWVPFTLKLFYPQTATLPEFIRPDGKGTETPDTNVSFNEKSFQLFTNSTYNYQFDLKLNYGDRTTPGTLVTEYWSGGNLVFRNAENIDGSNVCKRYAITTTAPPKFPTLSEILTNAGVQAVQEFQFIVPELKNVNATVALNTAFLALYTVVTFVLIFYLIRMIGKIEKEKVGTTKQIAILMKNSGDVVKKADGLILKLNEILDDVGEISVAAEKRIDSLLDRARIEFNTVFLEADKKIARLDEISTEIKNEKSELETKTNEVREKIKKEQIDFDKEKAMFELKKRKTIEKQTTVSDEKMSTMIGDLVDKPRKMASKFTSIFMHLGKSDKVSVPDKKLDFDLKDEPSEEEMFAFYILNSNDDNRKLYDKYFNLASEDRNNTQLAKRQTVLYKVLEEQMKQRQSQ